MQLTSYETHRPSATYHMWTNVGAMYSSGCSLATVASYEHFEQTTLRTRTSLSSRCTVLCGRECLQFLPHAHADNPTGNGRWGQRSPPCLLSLDHASTSEPPRLSPAVEQNQWQIIVISSNRILMSCQPHRVTSGQSHSSHKQMHISKLFSHMYQPSVKSIYKTNHFTNIKHAYANIRHKLLSVSPFNITPVKRAHKARTCWYPRPFHLIYWYQVKEKHRKGMDRHNKKNVI